MGFALAFAAARFCVINGKGSSPKLYSGKRLDDLVGLCIPYLHKRIIIEYSDNADVFSGGGSLRHDEGYYLPGEKPAVFPDADKKPL